jgi:flagellar motor switch protein FliN/FliY
MNDIAQEQASTLIQHFGEAASSVLSLIAGTTLTAQIISLDVAIDAATLVRIDITGALSGLCEIALSPAMTAQFAALLTGEIPDPAAEVSSDTREAAVELIQQICGNTADRLRQAFGPLELKPHLAQCDPETGARQLFRIARESGALEFEFHVVRLASGQKPDTIPELAAQATTQPGATTPPQNTQPNLQSAATPAPSESHSSGNRNLDLLLDIELGVTLRFGTRQMMLKDIIELCSGSVVELDRGVLDPVDLLIDGRVIAQGEVVIVEGNYGLRILKVAAQAEKIGCLP